MNLRKLLSALFLLSLPAMAQAADITGVPKIREGDHLQLFVRQGRHSMKCIAFGAGSLFEKLQQGMLIDIAVEPQLNEFNGFVSLAVKPLLYVPIAVSCSESPTPTEGLAGVIAIDSNRGSMTPTTVYPTTDPDEAKIVAPMFG